MRYYIKKGQKLNVSSVVVLASDRLYNYFAIFATVFIPLSAALLASTKMESDGGPLKRHKSPQWSRALMLPFLLHIAVHCQLFISYKASMATGSICLPA